MPTPCLPIPKRPFRANHTAALSAAAAVAALFALFPADARADDVVTNLGSAYDTGDPLDTSGFASAHAFTTGSDTPIRLDSVTVQLFLYEASTPEVKIWAGSGNVPTSVIEVLGSPFINDVDGRVETFNSTERPILQPNTRYWVSVSNAGGDFDWNLTKDPSNSSGGGSFEDLARESSDGGASWPGTGTTGQFHQFAVAGTPVVPGDIDPTFSPPTLNFSVDSMALQADGKVIVGGFTGNLKRLKPDGSVDESFSPVTLDGGVLSTALQADGKVIVGGEFTGNLKRLKPDGSVDDSFSPPTLGGVVFSTALQADGKVIVGGNVTGNLKRLKPDGSEDDSFSPPTLDGVVYSTALQADGKVIVGGKFTGNLKRLKPDGSVDESFSPPTLDSDVYSTALQADGKVIVGGNFTGGLKRLKPDGSVDDSFSPPTLDGVVLSTALQADGKVIVGGRFTGNLKRLKTDGSVDDSFSPPTLGGVVYSTALQTDGKVIVGGNVTGGLMRLENGLATGALTVPSLSRVQWLRGGTAPEATRTTFEASSDGGTSWTLLGQGSRISGGWQITGISVPGGALIRARAFTSRGDSNASSVIVEKFATAPAASGGGGGNGDNGGGNSGGGGPTALEYLQTGAQAYQLFTDAGYNLKALAVYYYFVYYAYSAIFEEAGDSASANTFRDAAPAIFTTLWNLGD